LPARNCLSGTAGENKSSSLLFVQILLCSVLPLYNKALLPLFDTHVFCQAEQPRPVDYLECSALRWEVTSVSFFRIQRLTARSGIELRVCYLAITSPVIYTNWATMPMLFIQVRLWLLIPSLFCYEPLCSVSVSFRSLLSGWATTTGRLLGAFRQPTTWSFPSRRQLVLHFVQVLLIFVFAECNRKERMPDFRSLPPVQRQAFYCFATFG